jgi:hypothetical protein
MSYNAQQPAYNDPNAGTGEYTTAPGVVAPPTIIRAADGSVTYYYNCTSADFANNSRWFWLIPFLGGILLIVSAFLPWLTVTIPTNSFTLNAFGGVGGSLPPEFTTTLTTGGQRESVLGVSPTTGIIMVIAGLAIVGLSVAGFFSSTPMLTYIVTGVAGVAMLFTLLQMLTFANRTPEITNFINRQAAQASAAAQNILTVNELRLATGWGVWVAVLAALLAAIGTGFQTYRTRTRQ